MPKLDGFKLSGKPLSVGGPPPIVQRGMKLLGSLPFGKLLTVCEFAQAIGTTADTIRQMFNIAATGHLRERVATGGARKMLYGSPRTIAALRKALGEAKNGTDH